MKKVLNIDHDFAPLGEGIQLKQSVFPAGEFFDKILEDVEDCDVTITTRLKPGTETHPLLAADALRRKGAKSVSLFTGYMPYARQDRVMTDGEALGIQVVARVINTGQFKTVTVYDAHSEVTGGALDNARFISNEKFVQLAIQDYLTKHNFPEFALICPDGGAQKKIYKVAPFVGATEVIEFTKKRDLQNHGALSGFHTYHEDFQGKVCFIVDDICDAGGTFLGINKILKEKNAGPVVLIVSHGIFSKGEEILKNGGIDKIYTTDSFQKIESDYITQIPLSSCL